MVILRHRGIPERHQRIADIFIQGSAMIQNNGRRLIHNMIDDMGQGFRRIRQSFGKGGEAANIHKHDGDFGFLAIQRRA